ncbi:hypothetical protein HNR06_002890 [Nocardiopsis arvandica]|uniref:Uncharacterized protein n=1 Tax=Nocardiopsis sinuspersici TaxID=501010 RepID=A0A7Y9XCH9_9ACTN|nr:immunity 49 family protein [Nocardiopsis sinuspersici]NYH53301.1 hypothetical protein [Nocardiopsis sinuspersici]
MTYSIPRHDASVPGYTISAKDHPEERETEASDVEDYPDSIDLSLNPLDLNAKVSLAIDPDAAQLETWEDWVAAMQIYNAMFEVTTNPEGTELELMVNHKVRRTTATGPRYCTNAGNWLTAFYYAVTCREEARRRRLCEIPVELLREAGESDGAQYNPYVYHWVAALQAYVLNRPGLGEGLAAALELSDPERVEFGPAEILNKLTFPP